MSESSSSVEAEGVDPAARPIRMHPLFDPTVLGATPFGQRLGYFTGTCERCFPVRGGCKPEDARVRVARMATATGHRAPSSVARLPGLSAGAVGFLLAL